MTAIKAASKKAATATKATATGGNTAKEINARSAEIVKGVKAVGKDIHKHLLTIAKHVFDHGDVTVADKFLSGLMDVDKEGNSRSIVRADAVKNWLETFGMCKWDGKEGKMKLAAMRKALLKDADAAHEHFKLARATTWNKLTPAKPFSGFDLDAALKAVLTRAETAEKKAREYAIEYGVPAEFNGDIEAFIAAKVKMPSDHMDALKAIVG